MGNNTSSVDDKPDINLQLIISCKKGEIEKVAHYLTSGADVNHSDNNNATPLMWACSCGHTNIAKYLIENETKQGQARARLTDVDKDGYTCLHWSVVQKQFSVVEYLLTKCQYYQTHKNAVNCRTTQGDTPLHKAIYYSQKPIAQLLINAGADINAYNNIHETPMDKARKNDIKLWFKSLGAKANLKSDLQTEGVHKQDKNSNSNSDVVLLSIEDQQYLRRKQMKERVTLWLKSDLSFPEYVTHFLDNGYDRFDAIIEMDNADLLDIGIKRGHAKIILKAIRNLNAQLNYDQQQQQNANQNQAQAQPGANSNSDNNNNNSNSDVNANVENKENEVNVNDEAAEEVNANAVNEQEMQQQNVESN